MCGGGGGGDGSFSGEPMGDLGFGAAVSTGNISGQSGIGQGGFGHIGEHESAENTQDTLATPSQFGEEGMDIPGVVGPSPQVSFSHDAFDAGLLTGGSFLGPFGGLVVGLGTGVAGSAIQGSGIEGMDMSGDPTGGNATGGPDMPMRLKRPALVEDVEEKEETEPIIPSSEPVIDPQDNIDEIDRLNKLASERNMRFAPARGEESLTRNLALLSERDQLIGARGPAMYPRKPRSSMERFKGKPLHY